MKLLIIGATGGTGQHLVEQALKLGHTVTAFVRTPSKLDITHENLQLFQGDVLELNSLHEAMVEQEAVLCALGLPASDRTEIRYNGTRNILEAMEKAGVKRLICQTSLGFGDSENILPLYFRYLIVPFILKHAFADSEKQEALIRQSHLEWIIVRPANLTDGIQTGSYRHGADVMRKKIKLKVSRADVAEFMLKQLEDDSYLYQTPGISY